MKLSYDHESGDDPKPLVALGRASLRIEFHLLQAEPQCWFLIALAGKNSRPADRSLVQGPYTLVDQAIAVRKAIAAEIAYREFKVDLAAHPQWVIDAQRQLKSIRQRRSESDLDFSFHPEDVYPDIY